MPALARNCQGPLRRCFVRHFYDGKVRNVRPLLGKSQRLPVQPVVQLLQPRGPMGNSDVNRGCGWNEGFHVAKNYLEGLSLAADPSQLLQRCGFARLQWPRRQQSEMGRKVGQVRMQLPPEVLDKLSVVQTVKDES